MSSLDVRLDEKKRGPHGQVCSASTKIRDQPRAHTQLAHSRGQSVEESAGIRCRGWCAQSIRAGLGFPSGFWQVEGASVGAGSGWQTPMGLLSTRPGLIRWLGLFVPVFQCSTEALPHRPSTAGFPPFHKNSQRPYQPKFPSPARSLVQQKFDHLRIPRTDHITTNPYTTPQHRQDGSRCRSPRWHKSTFNSDFRDFWGGGRLRLGLVAYFDKSDAMPMQTTADDKTGTEKTMTSGT